MEVYAVSMISRLQDGFSQIILPDGYTTREKAKAFILSKGEVEYIEPATGSIRINGVTYLVIKLNVKE